MRKLRTIAVWVLISIILQVGFLYFLNRQLSSNVDAATVKKAAPVIVQEDINLPGTDLSNLQASFDKHYMAYTDNGELKVYDVKAKKQVYVKQPPANGQLLAYKWLPDRNILLFVQAKPNPDPKPGPVAHYSQTQVQQNTPTDDPHQKATRLTTKQTVTYTTPYYNPQVTELYSVDFGEGSDTQTPNSAPAERFERSLDLPAGGVIESMDFSTYTNLIYMTVKTQYSQILYEIDVMRVVTELQRSGEKIQNISASDMKGTLYVQSQLYGINQIISIKHHNREQLLRGSQYVLLGQEDDKVMIGVVKDDNLTEILSLPDTGLEDPISKQTTVEWQGNIPWQNYNTIAGTDDFVVLYNVHGAVVFNQGKMKSVQFNGEHNYLTSDGREVMEVFQQQDGTTLVRFKPL